MATKPMYEDWGATFDHVPPACQALADWIMTPPDLREEDEGTLAGWCRKYGHSTSWAGRVQLEPEFQRLMAAKAEGMGFNVAHFRAVWENYYRLAANGSDFRAARNFLIDTKQIVTNPVETEDDGADEVNPEELKARHREIVLGEIQPATTTEEPQ